MASIGSQPRFAYVAGAVDDTLSYYAVQALTGQLRFVNYTVLNSASGPRALGLTASRKFLYVANFRSSNVAAFAVDAVTGALSPAPGSPFPCGSGPASITVDPSDSFLYVTNALDNSVSAFTIDAISGALAPIAGSPFPAGITPRSATVNRSGSYLYVANQGELRRNAATGSSAERGQPDTISRYSIDSGSGALTPVPGSPFSLGVGAHPTAVVVESSGTFLYVTNSGRGEVQAFSIDQNSGSLSSVPGFPIKVGSSPQSITLDASGNFAYIIDADLSRVSGYLINSSTGALAPVPGSPYATGRSPSSSAVDPSNKFFYVTNSFSDTTSVFARNLKSGALTLIGSMLTHSGPSSIAVSGGAKPSSFVPTFAYAFNNGKTTAGSVSQYRIDPNSGVLTPLAGGPVALGWDMHLAAVPPFGRYAYTGNWDGWAGRGLIIGLTVDPTSGSLTPFSSPAAAVTDGGRMSPEVAIDPSGRFLYVPNSALNCVRGFSIDQSNGALAPVVGTPFGSGPGPGLATTDPTGKFLYVTWQPSSFGPGGISGYKLDARTGALTLTGNVSTPYDPEAVTVDPSGQFAYVAALGTPGYISAFTIDSVTGALHEIAGSPLKVRSPWSLAIEPTGRFLYAGTISGAIWGFSINAASGALTPLATSPFQAGSSLRWLSVDPSGRFLYVAGFQSNNVIGLAIDAHTGALTTLNGSPFSAGVWPQYVTTIANVD